MLCFAALVLRMRPPRSPYDTASLRSWSCLEQVPKDTYEVTYVQALQLLNVMLIVEAQG